MARSTKHAASRTRPAAAAPAVRASDPIRRARAAGKSVGITIPRARSPLPLPDAVADLLADALDAHARGHRVELVVHAHADEAPIPYLILDRDPNDELTTQEAAAALRVSRPTIIKAIDEGRLPARKVGKHRRVRIYDFNAYAQADHSARVAHAMESTRLEQEWGLHEVEPLPKIDEWKRLIGRSKAKTKPSRERGARNSTDSEPPIRPARDR